MLSLTPEDFRAARWSFSLAAMILSGMTVFWSLNTNASASWRISVDASCAIAVACLLPAGLLWVSRRQHLSRTSSPPKPLIPHLTALTPIVRQAYRDDDGIVHFGRGPVEIGKCTIRYAILAPFNNIAKAGVQTRDAKDVSASVVFNGADGWPVTGAWLESATHTVDIPMGAPAQCVILAFAEQGGGAFVLSDERQGIAGRMTPISFCSYPDNGTFHRDFTIRVELMEGGNLALKEEYLIRITLPYPQASLASHGEPNQAVTTRLPDNFISDVAALHRANTLLKNEVSELRAKSEQRHLKDDQRHTIARVVRQGLHDLRESIRSSPTWTPDFKEGPIFVELYIVESERETSVYRADFERAFQDGGLGVMLGEIVGTLGERGNEQFAGVVSVLRESPENLPIRSFVLKALRLAGIAVNECDDLPNGLARYRHDSRGQALGVLGATLIIGQRG